MNIPASRPAATAAADAAFEEFVRGRSAYFFRLALVLTAWNRAAAEDVLQIALERTFRHRRTLFRADSALRPDPAFQPGSAEPYVRRIIVNAATDWRRTLTRRREQPLDAAAGVTARDQAGLVADRDALVRALAALPPKQRAVLVLRYWEDLPDPVIAAALNCSQATVRSQASRALARLRELDDGTLAGTPLADLPPAGAPHGGKRHD
ncbi:MAG TPA: sigma-70 family RNA polymerase sigma factor [Streptosporangiaceae bacterium]